EVAVARLEEPLALLVGREDGARAEDDAGELAFVEGGKGDRVEVEHAHGREKDTRGGEGPRKAGARAAATFADRIAPAARTPSTTRRLDHMGTRSLNAATGVGGLLVSFALVAGCGTSDPGMIVFTKAGASTADRQKDENDCLRSSVGVDDQTRILVPFQVDRAAYQKCMEARGYTASPAK